MSLKSIITLCRPGQWVKNLFVFTPLFFSGNLLAFTSEIHAVVAFISFCLASSAIYCLNDLKDVSYDRQHPVKRFRPVAAGEISTMQCIVIMLILAVISLVLPALLLKGEEALQSCLIIAGYIILNIAYCFRLKQIAIVDVSVISIGFVLRVGIGGTATGIELSPWIIIMTFLLALFLALSKRRDDILIYEATGERMRRNVEKYNLIFINQASTMVATVMLVSYIIYTVSPDVIGRFRSSYVYTTSIFVLLGLLRYMQLAIVYAKTGSPTKVLFHDRFIQLCVIGWLILFSIIIYF